MQGRWQVKGGKVAVNRGKVAVNRGKITGKWIECGRQKEGRRQVGIEEGKDKAEELQVSVG